jgi:hypothetical protein
MRHMLGYFLNRREIYAVSHVDVSISVGTSDAGPDERGVSSGEDRYEQ